MRASDAGGTALQGRAYAKVNTSLEVLGRRVDGYHAIVTDMLAINLADSLTFRATTDETIDLRVEPPSPLLSQNDNLVLRAAALLRKSTSTERGASIILAKRIPVAAGLGGGSSDAAATLHGLNRLWQLGLSTQNLAALGALLGSDVPYFVVGSGHARCTGRGEEVHPLPATSPALQFVLFTPSVAVPTATIYAALTADDVQVQRPGNALQGSAERCFPDICAARCEIERLTRRMWLMSGSGPTYFCPVADATEGRVVVRSIRRAGYRAWRVKSLRRTYALRWIEDGAARRSEK